ncbi:MAG: toxin-antitoxin system HicB family antitoxin [Nitrospinae bacterium]|nr:toxin-antitoxin system HicB family antitoxin [Nitrospinota bacterium]
MVNYEHYTYRVTWSEEDGEHVALCAEFPSLSYLAKTPAKALQNIMKLVKEAVEDMEANGESVPTPLAEKEYSGKFMIRIPPEQHKNLAMKAAEMGISLNRYVSSILL